MELDRTRKGAGERPGQPWEEARGEEETHAGCPKSASRPSMGRTDSSARRKSSDALWMTCCCYLQRDAEVRQATGAMEGLLRVALSSEANCLAFGPKHSVVCVRPAQDGRPCSPQRTRSKMARTRSQQPSTSLAADPADLSNRGRSRSRSETRVDAKEAVDLVYVTPPLALLALARPRPS
jgi:hypothetical protein